MKTSILLTSYFLLLALHCHALTREEIIERFRATPVVQVDGLVQVIPDCSAEMRRQYQLLVAGRAAGACRALYASEMKKPQRFVEPGIVIHIGNSTNAITNVVVRVQERGDGTKYTRIGLPAPGHSDQRALAVAIAQAYFLAVHGKTVDGDQAWHALMSSDPELRVAETCGRIADWSQRGVYVDGLDDEDYLKLSRKVLMPGRLTKHELNNFASRLYLYPLLYDAPFAGKYTSVDFETAVRLHRQDPRICMMAFFKSRQVLIFGAGRGEHLSTAANCYYEFLTALARSVKMDGDFLASLASEEGMEYLKFLATFGRDEKTDGELLALLDTANGKLRSLSADY